MGVSPVFSVLPVDGRDARPTKFLSSFLGGLAATGHLFSPRTDNGAKKQSDCRHIKVVCSCMHFDALLGIFVPTLHNALVSCVKADPFFAVSVVTSKE
jgi:hypothetical protein